MRRVVVTGIGLVTPLAIGTEGTWTRVIRGETGVGPIAGFDASALPCRLGAEIAEFIPEEFAHRRLLRMMTRNDQLALAGATLAIRDANLTIPEQSRGRIAVYVGTNKTGGNPHLMTAVLAADENGRIDTRGIGEQSSTFYPLFYVEGLPAAALFYISLVFGLMGSNAQFAGGTEAGLEAVGRAYRAIRRGDADIAVAGGVDDPVSWWNFLSRHDALGMLTSRNDLGAGACRPYDRARTGTVLGEGAAFLILENIEFARRRGARVYAEVGGFGCSFDASGILAPSTSGEGVAQAFRSALRDAGAEATDVEYVCGGSNGSVAGDAREVAGLDTVSSDASSPLTVSSVKAATGECLAGSGALNAAMTALALHHQIAPPTLNLECPEPARTLDWVGGAARPMSIHQAVALAEGLDGSDVALLMRAAAG